MIRHREARAVLVFLALAVLAVPAAAPARILGGGPSTTDCWAVWDGVTATRGPTAVHCEDGDPTCDADGAADGACTFGVNACVAQADVDGCTPPVLDAIRVPPLLLRAGGVVATPLVLPALDTGPACGSAAVVRLPLRGRTRRKPSKTLRLRMTASSAASRPPKDVDHLVLRCLPNAGRGQCPANTAGGPTELRLAVAAEGTDLDNGWLGTAHDFPFVAHSSLRLCLDGCDEASQPVCTVRGETGPDTMNGAIFGGPLPLFVAGVGTCISIRFDAPVTGTADVQTGVLDLGLAFSAEVYVAPSTVVCPQCSGNAVGDTGTCQAGPDRGKACRVDGTVLVRDAGNRVFKVSRSCRPEGGLIAKLKIPLRISTGARSLTGPRPCAGQLRDDDCGSGTCSAACAGDACIAEVPDPVDASRSICQARRGGASQLCCSSDPTRPCFPTAGGGTIERRGRTAPPIPAWPDPAYPKMGEAVVVDTFCEPATGENVLDSITTGLPGPGAVVLPVSACWLRDGGCP